MGIGSNHTSNRPLPLDVAQNRRAQVEVFLAHLSSDPFLRNISIRGVESSDMRRINSVMLVLVFSFLAAAQSLPRATPAEVGFSPQRLDYITQVLRDDADKGLVPGSVHV